MLTAIDLNTNGYLSSIDLPVKYWEKTEYRKNDKVNVKKEVGWLVPSNLRKNWSLTLGPSKDELPKVLNKIGKCDLFFHDSEHSYENMLFEFKTAWPFIPKQGLILADDIDRNDAFDDFVNSHKNKLISLKISQFGFIMKK